MILLVFCFIPTRNHGGCGGCNHKFKGPIQSYNGGVEKMNGGRDFFHAPRWPAKWWYLAMIFLNWRADDHCWCECVILIIWGYNMLQTSVKCEESQDACLKVKTHLMMWWLLMREIVIFTSFVLTDLHSSLIQDRFLQNSSSPVSGVTGRPGGFPLAPKVFHVPQWIHHFKTSVSLNGHI